MTNDQKIKFLKERLKHQEELLEFQKNKCLENYEEYKLGYKRGLSWGIIYTGIALLGAFIGSNLF